MMMACIDVKIGLIKGMVNDGERKRGRGKKVVLLWGCGIVELVELNNF